MKLFSLFSFTFCLLIFISSCKSSKEQAQEDGSKVDFVVQETPEILLVNFSLKSNDSIIMISSMKNFGRLRGESDSKSEPNEGDLIISFLNESNTVCTQTILQNPLVKRLEYSETDDISTLSSKTVELDSVEFFVRVQYDPCFKHIKVEKFTEDKIVGIKVFRFF